jgi:SAM-dependent methyltransferase
MHPTARAFATTALECRPDGPVLEVGSKFVNGRVRNASMQYIGIDMRLGPDVDVQARGEALPFSDNQFATVISCGTLEHASAWRAVCVEMCRVLRPAGLLALSTHNSQWPEHGFDGEMPLPLGMYYGAIDLNDLTSLVSAQGVRVHYAQETKAGDVFVSGHKGAIV